MRRTRSPRNGRARVSLSLLWTRRIHFKEIVTLFCVIAWQENKSLPVFFSTRVKTKTSFFTWPNHRSALITRTYRLANTSLWSMFPARWTVFL